MNIIIPIYFVPLEKLPFGPEMELLKISKNYKSYLLGFHRNVWTLKIKLHFGSKMEFLKDFTVECLHILSSQAL